MLIRHLHLQSTKVRNSRSAPESSGTVMIVVVTIDQIHAVMGVETAEVHLLARMVLLGKLSQSTPRRRG